MARWGQLKINTRTSKIGRFTKHMMWRAKQKPNRKPAFERGSKKMDGDTFRKPVLNDLIAFWHFHRGFKTNIAD